MQSPSYYSDLNPQPITVMQAWKLRHTLCCVIKYLVRAGRKPGSSEIDDLKKAREYLDFEITHLESQAPTFGTSDVKPIARTPSDAPVIQFGHHDTKCKCASPMPSSYSTCFRCGGVIEAVKP